MNKYTATFECWHPSTGWGEEIGTRQIIKGIEAENIVKAAEAAERIRPGNWRTIHLMETYVK